MPDAGYAWSAQRGREIRQTFQRLIALVQEEKPELLLIAGDLFHRQPQMSELKEVNYLFSKIPQTKVVLIAGNHDYIDRKGFWEEIDWSENVIPLFGQQCESVAVPELDLRLYGCSYHSREIKENLYQNVKPVGNEKYHLLLMHGGDAKHSPFDKNQRNLQSFDYLAAGHIHKPEILLPGKMAFCGALEPLDRNDTGMHGYMDVQLLPTGNTVRFVPFAQRSYRDLPVQLTEDMSRGEVRDRIRDEMKELGENDFYRIILRGVRHPHTDMDTEELENLGNVTEVLDESHAAWDYEEIMRQYQGSLPAEFIRQVLQASEDESVRELALEYGMDALFGK